jgi:ketosteroid isomerase-like protein
MPQGQPAAIGKKAIRSLYQSFFKTFTVKGKGKVVEAEVSGDLGYFWSNYMITATPKAGGDQIKGEGKSVFIVKRQDDNSWKIARLIDNSDHNQSAAE